jgi:hypothetical protein
MLNYVFRTAISKSGMSLVDWHYLLTAYVIDTAGEATSSEGTFNPSTKHAMQNALIFF